MAFSLGSLSAPAKDFFSQFQPYEQGGITGQPTVDPGQLQPPPASSGIMSQGGPISDPRWTNGTWGDATTMPMQPAPMTPYGPIDYSQVPGGYDPNWKSKPYDPNNPRDWGVVSTLPMLTGGGQPTIDPSRYDPSKTFEDYYRDYHSPDRDAVLRDYPGMAKHHLMGGSVGRLGSLSSTLPSQGQQGVLNALMHRVMAPDGRMVQVPDHQLADVLQRGGRKVGGF